MSFGIKIQEVKKQITKSWRKKQHKNDCNIQQEGILHAHACIRWTTIVGAHQIWRREIENSRKVTFLLKAISLVLWIPYFPTKNGLHDKNWTFSTRVLSCRFFMTSSRFSWPFQDFKRLNAKNHCSCINLIFTGKAREVYLFARCLMLNWSRRYTFVHATKTWNLWEFFLWGSFREFSRKNI